MITRDPWYHAEVRMRDAYSRASVQIDWAVWAAEWDIENVLEHKKIGENHEEGDHGFGHRDCGYLCAAGGDTSSVG